MSSADEPLVPWGEEPAERASAHGAGLWHPTRPRTPRALRPRVMGAFCPGARVPTRRRGRPRKGRGLRPALEGDGDDEGSAAAHAARVNPAISRISQTAAERLETARDVIVSTMQHADAIELFNKPVDPVAQGIPNYLDLIKEPMDLGTIFQRLDAAFQNNWEGSYYKDAREVMQDVDLVWDNCYTYNCKPEDIDVRNMCQDVQQYFTALWDRAGLSKPVPASSIRFKAKKAALADYADEDLPDAYSLHYGDCELPLRWLDSFTFCSGSSSSKLIPLHMINSKSRGASSMVARGTALPLHPDSSCQPVNVCISICLDWCIDYSRPFGVWLITPNAWYKLLHPSSEYQAVYQSSLKKIELCRTLTTSAHHVDVDIDRALANSNSASLSADDLQAESKFVLSQIKAWSTLAENEQMFLDKTTKRATALYEQLKDRLLSHGAAETSSPSMVVKVKLRRSAAADSDPAYDSDCFSSDSLDGSRSSKKSSSYEDDVESDDPEYMPARKPTQRKQKRQKITPADRRVARQDLVERTNNLRGPPPSPDKIESLPDHWTGELLTIWEFSQAFGPVMGIPPYPLWRLRAAIFPLPPAFYQPDFTSWAATTAGCLEEAGSMERSNKLTFKFLGAPIDHDTVKSGTAEVYQSDEGGCMKVEELKEVLLDTSGIASAALMRDLHLGLLSVLDDRAGPNNSRVQPTSGRGAAVEGNGPYWPERVLDLLLEAEWDKKLTEKFEGLADTFKLLQAGAYGLTTPMQRIAILKALQYLALERDALRTYYQSELDSIAAIAKAVSDSQKPPVPLLSADDGDQPTPQPLPAPAMQVPRLPPNTIGGWMRWRCVSGLGLGATLLGEDVEHRRYWVLGGQAGAWRVFVESSNGEQWGLYEGERVRELLDWLNIGNVKSEKRLIGALEMCPVPPWDVDATEAATSQVPNNYNSETSSMQKEKIDGTKSRYASELDKLRPDGYKLIVDPVFMGLWDYEPSKAPPNTLPESLSRFANSLISWQPFWTYSGGDHHAIAQIMDAFWTAAYSSNMYTLRELIITIQRQLISFDQVAAAWTLSGLSNAWESAVRECRNAQGFLMLMERLQLFCKRRSHLVSRGAFMSMAKTLKCQLYFPLPGEYVVLARTGCMLHLQRHLNGTFGADLLGAERVEQLLNRVASLRPLGRYKVISVAYTGLHSDEPFAKAQGAKNIAEVKGQDEETPSASPRSAQHDGKAECNTGANGHAYIGQGKDQVPVAKALAYEEQEAPIAWFILQPAPGIGSPIPPGSCTLAVPVPINNELPDYLVPAATCDKAMLVRWAVGNRFGMYFGGKQHVGVRHARNYYMGKIIGFSQPAQPPQLPAMQFPGNMLYGQPFPVPEYDPWESIYVVWDGEEDGEQNRVSPWEIEMDPDGERLKQEERARQEALANRMAREAARQAAIQQQRAEEMRQQIVAQHAARAKAALDAKIESDRVAVKRALQAGIRGVPPGTRLPSVPLQNLKLLQWHGFSEMVEAYYLYAGKKFKVPVFAHEPLDLYKVFIEVQRRGGFHNVTDNKQWRDVCRSLKIDLSGQTSASFNMRTNYEKCLLDFEDFVCTIDGDELAEASNPLQRGESHYMPELHNEAQKVYAYERELPDRREAAFGLGALQGVHPMRLVGSSAVLGPPHAIASTQAARAFEDFPAMPGNPRFS